MPEGHGRQAGQCGFFKGARGLGQHRQALWLPAQAQQRVAQVNLHAGGELGSVCQTLQRQLQHLHSGGVVAQLQQVLAHAVRHLGGQVGIALGGLGPCQGHGVLEGLSRQGLLVQLVQHPRHGQGRLVALWRGVYGALVGSSGLLQLAHLAAQVAGFKPGAEVGRV